MSTENDKAVDRMNDILLRAIKANASDIHFECFEKRALVRFRVDGILQVAEEVSREDHEQLICQAKKMGALSLEETRRPQDGRIMLSLGGEKVDLRVSTSPCLYGESTVMRILATDKINLDMDRMGLSEDHLATLKSWYQRPYGLVFVSGPAGSGKTTLLYAMMNDLNSEAVKIMTVEDPVEYAFDGINQVRYNPQIGLTFAGALRSIMRQDPDVIVLTEIRDQESAQIMAQIALTGHLGLTQLHTNSATAVFERLLDLGIEPFLITNAVVGAVNMRLVRKLCPDCREEYEVDKASVKELRLPTNRFYQSKGCENCRKTGFGGRIPVYELFGPSTRQKRLIMQHCDEETLRNSAIAEGLVTLWQDGVNKAAEGLTSLEELRRVVQPG